MLSRTSSSTLVALSSASCISIYFWYKLLNPKQSLLPAAPAIIKSQSSGDLTSETPTDSTPPNAIWFGGGSWASTYHTGVLMGLRNTFGAETVNNTWKAGGASAGAAVALGMLLGKTEFEFLTFFITLAERARRLGVIRKMSTYTNEFLREWLPDGGDEYLYLNGRLFIGVTRFPYGDEVISQWSSNRDLRNTCNASMCIPFYTNAEVLNVNGRWVADGCLTQDTNDIPGCNTVKVTIDLTNTEAHILGSGMGPMDVLFPNSEERVRANFEKGVAAGRAWRPWQQVEQGLMINAFKYALNLTARVYVANVARVGRMLEMLCMRWGLLTFEPLAMMEEDKKTAKWEPSKDGRFNRRSSLSMG